MKKSDSKQLSLATTTILGQAPRVEIFSQGEEIVTGQTVDTNAAWLSDKLVQMGFTITRHTSVGDKLDDLAGLLKEVSSRADCCICTGGLGPTVDDLTSEAVSLAFEVPLKFDETVYRQISDFFSRRNRTMPEANRKQAMIPQGALRLDNEWGTAPGFVLKMGCCRFFFVPGVPYEMKQLFREKIQPILANRYELKPLKLVTIKTIGIGESDIQERMNSVIFPDGAQLSFRAGKNEVQTKLLFPAGFSETEMAAFSYQVAGNIGDKVFLIEGLGEQTGDLVSVVGERLKAEQKTLAVVETLSQGLMASKCMGESWLIESLFAQSVEKLFCRLGLPLKQETMLQRTARAAAAVKEQSGAAFALVQLYSGSDDMLKDQHSTITLYCVLLTDQGSCHREYQIGGPIKRKQNQAALLSFDLIRRFFQKQN